MFRSRACATRRSALTRSDSGVTAPVSRACSGLQLPGADPIASVHHPQAARDDAQDGDRKAGLSATRDRNRGTSISANSQWVPAIAVALRGMCVSMIAISPTMPPSRTVSRMVLPLTMRNAKRPLLYDIHRMRVVAIAKQGFAGFQRHGLGIPARRQDLIVG